MTHCRTVLLRVTEGLSRDDLYWRVLPDSKTIGEILLHVAAFEFVLISAVERTGPTGVDHDLWNDLKGGFSREAGFARPTGVTLEDCVQLLARVRERTRAFFGREAASLVKRGRVDIPGLVAALAERDSMTEPVAYQRLQQGVGTSFVDDGAVVREDHVDLPEILRLHETYHRGQITFQKYLLRRLKHAGIASLAP